VLLAGGSDLSRKNKTQGGRDVAKKRVELEETVGGGGPALWIGGVNGGGG